MREGTGARVLLALAAALLLAAAVQAEDITITPSNEIAQGWKHTATYGAAGGFSVAPPGAGSGAWFANTGANTSPVNHCGQVFLGTNILSGIALSDIRELKYTCFTGNFNTYMVNRFPRTPIQLQLVVTKNASSTDPTRYLMYRAWDWRYNAGTTQYPYLQECYPYSGETVPVPGGYFTSWYNEWQTYDCMTENYGCWVDFVGANYNGAKPFIGDWENVLIKYPGGKIKTQGATPVWPGTWGNGSGQNPNGTCFNLVAGSPNDEGGSTVNLSWQDNCNMRAYVDSVTIGYNSVPGNPSSARITKTFYFRPDGTPRTVCTTGKSAAYAPIIDKAKLNNYFVLYGTVLSDPGPSGSEFTMQDATGIKVKVKAYGHLQSPGDLVRVKGVLDRYGPSGNNITIWSDAYDIKPLD